MRSDEAIRENLSFPCDNAEVEEQIIVPGAMRLKEVVYGLAIHTRFTTLVLIPQ